MACERAPNRRVQMIQRLEDTLALDGRAVPLSSQDFGERARREDGRAYQAGFTFRDYPQWTYLVQGVEVVKRAALMPGENTVALVYEINNRSRSGAVLRVTPHLRFVPKGEALRPGQQFTLEKSCVRSNGRTLYFQTSGRTVPLPQALRGAFHFAQDAMDGKPAAGWAVVNHCVELSVPAGESGVLEAVYGTAWPLPGRRRCFPGWRPITGRWSAGRAWRTGRPGRWSGRRGSSSPAGSPPGGTPSWRASPFSRTGAGTL